MSSSGNQTWLAGPPIQFDDLPIEFSIKWWIFQPVDGTFEEKPTRDLMAEFRRVSKVLCQRNRGQFRNGDFSEPTFGGRVLFRKNPWTEKHSDVEKNMGKPVGK